MGKSPTRPLAKPKANNLWQNQRNLKGEIKNDKNEI